MLLSEVCQLVDGWVAAEEALFRTAGEAVAATSDADAKVLLAELSRHAGGRALRWADVRPVVPIADASSPVAASSPGAMLDALLASYGEAMRRAEPASDGPVLAVLRACSLEVSADRRRLVDR